ncbi:hypothetical protein BKA61DRAFT_596936 [Leptodontidium sp. MPI-SDFR-AT-0119]|nr:hypothetical protein BKA61DRAFT_596936 [Leptodontidium sp. MPI-SDFR-AT-0119]
MTWQRTNGGWDVFSPPFFSPCGALACFILLPLRKRSALPTEVTLPYLLKYLPTCLIRTWHPIVRTRNCRKRLSESHRNHKVLLYAHVTMRCSRNENQTKAAHIYLPFACAVASFIFVYPASSNKSTCCS